MMPIGHFTLDIILRKTQQDFLQEAITELALTRAAFAERIGAPWETFKKWLLPSESNGSREMPAVAWALVREVLEHERLKQESKPGAKT